MRGHIYAVCMMLSPDSRYQFFLSDDWADAKELRDQYRSLGSTLRSFLHNLVYRQKTSSKVMLVEDKMTQYLNGNVTDSESLSFWREHQSHFLAIVALTRDVLTIPATGVKVERLFNTTRDIYHHRRGCIKSKTVEELMLFLCTSRFDLNVQEAKEII
ncbi:unnamed protein product [Penicillium salamii]|uniref:HAT C-terminal dimerisation domain-containing protein n=1 Tax=Penicillium salamii TaxID=1612424 RepID=A0A9W4I8L4_9EURO|nr:unnamed protein product [Penicillium salamii]